MPRDFSLSKIYCIKNHIDDDIYVGSTIQDLKKRMNSHLSMMKTHPHITLYTKMNLLGSNNFYIELIKECPCQSSEELRKIEGNYIKEIATLNKRIAGRCMKDYFKDNKEQHKINMKQYYIKNKEARIKYAKDYQKNNVVNYMCPCGGKYSTYQQQNHEQTKKHKRYLLNES